MDLWRAVVSNQACVHKDDVLVASCIFDETSSRFVFKSRFNPKMNCNIRSTIYHFFSIDLT